MNGIEREEKEKKVHVERKNTRSGTRLASKKHVIKSECSIKTDALLFVIFRR